MTGVVAPYTFNTTSFQTRNGLAALEQAQADEQGATTSGVRSATYAGLGSSRQAALALQPALTQVAAWQGNITTAQNTLGMAQSSLQQISSIASTLGQTLGTLRGTFSGNTVAGAVVEAKSALSALGNLLNTQNGDTYVFAGSDTTHAPITNGADLASSPLASQIQAAVASAGVANGNDVGTVLSETLSAAGTTATGEPFSAALSTDPVSASGNTAVAQIGDNYQTPIGVVATQGGAPSAISTGSPIRDLMRNLMVVASLGSVSPTGTAFDQIVQGLQQTNDSVMIGLANMSGQIGVSQNVLQNQGASLSQVSTMMSEQLGQAKNVDLAQLSVQLTATQTQLQASYSLVADMKSMTLANYI